MASVTEPRLRSAPIVACPCPLPLCSLDRFIKWHWVSLGGRGAATCGQRLSLLPPPSPNLLWFCTVLGRFVYCLNTFCKDKYGMEYDVSDYWVYEFAKVSPLPSRRQKGWTCARLPRQPADSPPGIQRHADASP